MQLTLPFTLIVHTHHSQVRKIPLEVFVTSDKQPIYGTTFDDDGRGGYASKLPFNAYGAMGMAREEYDADSASSQWFWLLFSCIKLSEPSRTPKSE